MEGDMVITERLNLDDEALVRLATGGDRFATEVLLQRHAPTAVAYACSILANREDALDAAQNKTVFQTKGFSLDGKKEYQFIFMQRSLIMIPNTVTDSEQAAPKSETEQTKEDF